MMLPPQAGGSIGFEETEEIGPDGKAHVVSEKSFGGPSAQPLVSKKLTPAQKAQQKALQQEMQAMAADMGHMFSNGDFGFAPAGGGSGGGGGQDAKYQQDLFKNAMKTFQTAGSLAPGKKSQALATTGFPSGVEPADDADIQGHYGGYHEAAPAPAKATSYFPHFWLGIICGAAALFGGLVLLRYYRTHMMYRPVGTESGADQLPFRSL